MSSIAELVAKTVPFFLMLKLSVRLEPVALMHVRQALPIVMEPPQMAAKSH
jgi:hypothetical protein